MPCFIHLTPNNFDKGLENRFNNETLSIICAISRLFELKAEQSCTELLSKEFVLNSDKLKGELRLLRCLPDFVAGPSNKTIHQ